LTWLDYRGPGAIDWKQRTKAELGPDHLVEPDPGTEGGYRDEPEESEDAQPAPATKRGTIPIDDDDDFGDFFEGERDDQLQVQDDGFGDFQANSPDPFGLSDDFDDIAIGPAPDIKKRRESNDLMMLFDDETPGAPVSAAPLPARGVIAPLSTGTSSTKVKTRPKPVPPPPPLSSTVAGDALLDVFKTHHDLLLPYYLSLLQHTTSSLVFSSPTLTPVTRSQVLSSLVRFCQPMVAPTRSLPQRMTVLRNVQSATDFFESALLAEFERADTRRDEQAMKEKAIVLAELKSSSVIQVFVQKREIFYDQSHNPLRNLV
jgi:recyclin-1